MPRSGGGICVFAQVVGVSRRVLPPPARALGSVPVGIDRGMRVPWEIGTAYCPPAPRSRASPAPNADPDPTAAAASAARSTQPAVPLKAR